MIEPFLPFLKMFSKRSYLLVKITCFTFKQTHSLAALNKVIALATALEHGIASTLTVAVVMEYPLIAESK